MLLLHQLARNGPRVAWDRLPNAVSQAVRGFASTQQLDCVVIGGGPGGYVASIKAGQLGLKTACVEGRGALGGTCLNVGCIPSKALLNASHKYHDALHHMASYGVIVGDVKIDWPAMQKQKDVAVSGLTKGIEGLLKKNKVEYVKGWGKVTGPNSVEVTLADGSSTTLQTKNILIATGSEVTPMPGITMDEEKFVSSTGALALKELPKSMIVIGGGYIGLEMGSVYARLGAKVTVVEFLDNIVPSMDSEIRRSFQRSLEKQGLKFQLGTKVVKGELVDGRPTLTVEPSKGGPATQLDADVVLVSIGRRPYVKGLGLEAAGVKLDARGRVQVDDHFRTNVPSIYAIGDVIPGPMLAHKAEEDGVAAVEIMAGRAGHVNYNTVPSICYTHPEVAQVGMTEDEAKKAGIAYKVGKFSMMANSRARAQDDSEGLVKMIADAKTDKLLGAHIMAPSAGEMIHEVVVALEYGASTEDIARTCHGHPTLSEAVKEAALATAFGKPIHM
ncbi:dihydrolipoyl dehydrogenase [Haematococcus lacustris]